MAIAVTMATSRPSVVVSSLLFPTSDHLCEFLEILDFWERIIPDQGLDFGRSSLEELLVVQSYFFRLHHRAGSDPLELHGTVYSVVCLKCGNSINRDSFQDRVKALNPKWAAAIESLEWGDPGSDKSFGMQQRPDADIEIDAKFWEEDFEVPNCQQCGGILKPDVSILHSIDHSFLF
ncbi:hypothetical protein GW17_00020063 [Ensete ventricosum]|nr:hypothetical protein GW17_00020063 [Ensete ventricosum]